MIIDKHVIGSISNEKLADNSCFKSRSTRHIIRTFNDRVEGLHTA